MDSYLSAASELLRNTCHNTHYIQRDTHLLQSIKSTVNNYHNTHSAQYTPIAIQNQHSTHLSQYRPTTIHTYHNTPSQQYASTTIHTYRDTPHHNTLPPQYTLTTNTHLSQFINRKIHCDHNTQKIFIQYTLRNTEYTPNTQAESQNCINTALTQDNL